LANGYFFLYFLSKKDLVIDDDHWIATIIKILKSILVLPSLFIVIGFINLDIYFDELMSYLGI